MTRYVVLLRGINVGGHRRLPMAELRDLLANLGYEDVATYIQSGNAVLSADADEATLVAGLAAAIHDRFGFGVPVVARSAQEIATIAAMHPLGEREADEAKLHVMFLDAAPVPQRVADLDAAAWAPDEVTLSGREVYIAYRDGAGRSKVTADAVERVLGVTATARNWRTVRRLASMTAGEG